EQIRCARDRREVEIDEVVDRAHLRVLRRVVEPAGTDREVAFTRTPRAAVGIAVLQHLRRRVAADAGDADDVGVDGGPVGIAGDAALVADPADVGAGVGEHHRTRLQLPHQAPRARPAVVLLLPALAY